MELSDFELDYEEDRRKHEISSRVTVPSTSSVALRS